MESLAQELIDKVIDNLPHSSLHSCSLVGRRWRRRSQGRVFAFVEFSSERDLALWCANIPQGPHGIPSYVRSVQFQDINSWRDPALFGRVLKTFTSLTKLLMLRATIPRPHELPDSVSFGEFGKKIKYLLLVSPQCTVATIAALVLSLPNLETFFLVGIMSGNPPSNAPHLPQRRPLVELQLYTDGSGIGTPLARCGLTTRKLCMIVSDAGLGQLLTISSEVIVELGLRDEDPSQTRQANEPLPAVLLPPLPALTTLRIGLCSGGPFPRLAHVLSSIHSAPALTSITFTFDRWWYGEYFPSSDPWVEVDKWLAKMALQTEVKGSLTMILAQQREDGTALEGYFPEFRKAGGELG